MAKFRGMVGYGYSAETAPGVHRDVVTERECFGDILRNTRRLADGESVNDDLSVGNSISIVADDYARGHFHAIKYVNWSGALWTVTEVTVESPRLVLRLGGAYNGPTA